MKNEIEGKRKSGNVSRKGLSTQVERPLLSAERPAAVWGGKCGFQRARAL